ncbi:MAG: hypothetical protein HY860_06930 [Chlamydiales bacterium]|nr:hypothetical protein [Chlamydiales bacterium]
MYKRLSYALPILVYLLFPMASEAVISDLNKYQMFLESGTYDNLDWTIFAAKPKSRFYTLKRAFEEFANNNGKTIVELGTLRSFVDGKYIGCNSDDTKYWESNNPEKWDWGAGFFSYLAAACLSELNPTIHTVDIISSHIKRCQTITAQFKHLFTYHVSSSEDFLNQCKSQSIDLLYMDTGDIYPIEPSAQLHLREAKIIVKKDLIPSGGLILIDDVKHPVPIKLDNDKTFMGKAKYSLPYLLSHGFEIIEDEFQVLLRKK